MESIWREFGHGLTGLTRAPMSCSVLLADAHPIEWLNGLGRHPYGVLRASYGAAASPRTVCSIVPYLAQLHEKLVDWSEREREREAPLCLGFGAETYLPDLMQPISAGCKANGRCRLSASPAKDEEEGSHKTLHAGKALEREPNTI